MSSGKSGLATGLGLRGKDPNSFRVPAAPNVDSSKEQLNAIAGNLGALPRAEELAGKTNDANARQWFAMMEKLIPGFADISKTIAGNIQSQVSGELPKDLEQRIGRWSAERGISRGTGGSQFDKFGQVRDLGLTSLDMIDRGLSSVQKWMSSQPQPFNVTSMFLNSSQRIATEQWNEVNRFNTQLMREQVRMLPSNEDLMYAQILDYVADFATTAAGAGMGGVGGGGAAGMAGGAAGAGAGSGGGGGPYGGGSSWG